MLPSKCCNSFVTRGEGGDNYLYMISDLHLKTKLDLECYPSTRFYFVVSSFSDVHSIGLRFISCTPSAAPRTACTGENHPFLSTLRNLPTVYCDWFRSTLYQPPSPHYRNTGGGEDGTQSQGGRLNIYLSLSLSIQGCGIKMRTRLGEWILMISDMNWEHSIIIMW